MKAESVVSTGVQPFLFADGPWVEVRDGDASGRAIFHRHYSHKRYADGRKPKLFVGPGAKMVLLWRKFISSGNAQAGVNCAVFRNEGAGLSSQLIRDADALAWKRWPDEPRHYTYVNPRRVESRNPGFCFLAAGWRKCGVTKWNKLLIMEVAR